MRILTYVTVVFLVVATICMKQNVSLAKDSDTEAELEIAEITRAVQKDLGFDKIQTLRCKMEIRGKDIHWVTTISFKRPQFIRKEWWIYDKEGKLTTRSLHITDGLNLQKVKLDVDGRPVEISPITLLKAQKVYILRSKEVKNGILDEATSFVDSESEKQIRKTISNPKQKGVTIIVVAHRLSMVRDADEIVVLQDGKIVERGTHDELLLAQGLYKKFYDASASQSLC
ncbi:TPA: hypothetical protein EYP66_23420 [Candidatus Poribacteria bacterium]|nr:hypothetical protein [Candidatus Poribacteria bacterium]